jgi:hypothetical protein
MPCRWSAAELGDFHGLARFTRKFGYPGRVDDSEHVWLTCDGITGSTEVLLNGRLLTSDPCTTFAFDVTPILAERNQLEVLIHGDTDATGLWGEVAMEIRKDAYLADVQVERSGATTAVVIGKIAGAAPQPLELYTLVDGRHVDYRTIQPGQSFRIELAGTTSSDQTVRVELIHISSIWYVVEIPIPHWHSA